MGIPSNEFNVNVSSRTLVKRLLTRENSPLHVGPKMINRLHDRPSIVAGYFRENRTHLFVISGQIDHPGLFSVRMQNQEKRGASISDN
jgi:hypothetical protein